MKILFLHGFYASGQCVPAVALKEALEGKAKVLTPDLPMHPKEAINFIREQTEKEKPDILVGNSCGSFYAQMIAPIVGLPALLGNPHFKMTEFLKPRIGAHQYKSPRQDGKQDFIIDEQLIAEFAEIEAHQFDNYNPEYKDKIWGIFGEQDTLAHFEPLFLQYYTHSYHFPGGHTPTAEEVHKYYVPLIRKEFEENQQVCTMNKGLIIFDFDGTLGDTRRNIVTTMQMTIAELGLPSRNDAECASTIGLPLYGCFEALYPDTDKGIIQECTDTYRRLFQENLRTIKPQTFPKVIETLYALKEQGLTIAIASSRSHASLVELTRDLGISDVISCLIGADDVKKAKPNPEPVLNILAALGYEASETLVVGDMNVDILMGVKAGAKTCGVTYGNGTIRELEEVGADYIINSFDELTGIVNRWRRL